MAIIGWIYSILGVTFYFLAAVNMLKLNEVRFPRWIRVSYLSMVGILNLSVSSLFFRPTTGNMIIYFRIGASVFDIFACIVAAYICVYKITIRSSDFVYRTLFCKKVIAYGDITGVRAEIGRGVISFVLTARGRKIALNKIMQGYDRFYDKLSAENIFVRFPIV